MGQKLRYDHPHFTVIRHAFFERAAPAASLVPFALFRTRTKSIVRAAHVYCQSAPSAASGRIVVSRGSSASRTLTVSTASLVAGASFLLTLTDTNTLSTITENINVSLTGTEKGKWSVMYEYQVLPGPDAGVADDVIP